MSVEMLTMLVKEIVNDPEKAREFIRGVVNIGELMCSELEPPIKKLSIKKSVEYTSEKFNLFLDNGFTREEALQLTIAEKQNMKNAVSNTRTK